MSKAFEDFIIARCTEIAKADSTCEELIIQIIEISLELKSVLTPSQYDIFLKYDKIIASLQAQLETITYKQALKDRDLLT